MKGVLKLTEGVVAATPSHPAREIRSVNVVHVYPREASYVLVIADDCGFKGLDRSGLECAHVRVEIDHLETALPGVDEGHHVVDVELKFVIILEFVAKDHVSHCAFGVVAHHLEELLFFEDLLSL